MMRGWGEGDEIPMGRKIAIEMRGSKSEEECQNDDHDTRDSESISPPLAAVRCVYDEHTTSGRRGGGG